LFESLGGSP